MPAIDRIDFYDRATFEQSRLDALANGGVRPLSISGLNTGTSLATQVGEAAAYANASLPVKHPADLKTPLDSVRMRMKKSGYAIGEAVYRHGPTSNPSTAPFLLGTETTAARIKQRFPRRYHDDDNNGSFEWVTETTEGKYSVKERTRKLYLRKVWVNIKLIRVRLGRLTAAQVEAVDDLNNYHNEDAVVILGRCRPPDTLVCLGPDIVGVDESGTPKYVTDVLFHYNRAGYGDWELETNRIFEPDAGTGAAYYREWVLNYDPTWLKTPFAEAFPCWDPSLASGAGAVGSGPDVGSCTLEDVIPKP